jgi:adenylate cyclase
MELHGRRIPSDEVRAELQRIVASREFDASERNHRFLAYVVEETLLGRGGNIKAYSIATTVFGRDSNFDPQADPIIRIEASRLRRSLERYYLTAGKDNAIRIEIPKGTYIPTFHAAGNGALVSEVSALSRIDVSPAVHGPPPTLNVSANGRRRPLWSQRQIIAVGFLGALLVGWLGTAWFVQYPPFDALPAASQVAARGPSILVAPFENDDSDAIDSALVRGFTREVIIGLTRFDDLFVFGPTTSFRYEGSGDLPGSVARLPVDFVLTGGVMVSDSRLRAAVTLRNAKTGRYVWSDTIERELTVGGIFQAREIIANQVVQALAQPYGIIFREKSKEIEGTLPQFFTSYQCMLEFYNYWRSLSLPLHATVQSCLEKAVIQDPDYSEAYSALAMVYANIPRYGFNSHGVAFDPLPKALELARHSIELAPDSVQGYKALHLVYWLMNDVNRSFAAAEQGLALNPNDSEIMADLGGRLCLAGNWERGMPLVQEAFARNPDQPGLYRIVTSLRFYLDGRYKEALAEIEKANIPSVIHYHVILAMAHAQLGQMKQADAEVKEVLKIDPAYGENVIADLRKHNVYPDLIHAVVEGLRKAGLKVSDSVADRAS